MLFHRDDTFDLRKDEPHPVTGLFPSSQFIKDCAIDVVLRFKKALEIMLISLGCARDASGFFQ